MAYRGEDLDLRTPQTWSAGPEPAPSADPQSTFNGQRGLFRGNAIWVDDTILAVANHAFDVALAHRSAEVRLEHLIYALTRLEASSDVLEARGVRVAALRRDAAITIASEIPTSLTSGKQPPRRSDELAEVLRLAAQSASRRGGPGTAEDVLNVLMDLRPDHPAGVLLQRHIGRGRDIADYPLVTQRFASDPPRARPMPSMVPEPPSRSEPVRDYRAEPYRYDMPAVPVPPDYAPRLAAIEEALHGLSGSVSSETGMLNELIADVSRALAHQRDESTKLQAGVVEHLRTGETRLDARLVELGQRWSGLADRLGQLEQTLATLPKSTQATLDLSGLTGKLDTIEELILTRPEAPWRDMDARVSGLSSDVNSVAANLHDGFGRIADVDTSLQNLGATVSHALTAVTSERHDIAKAVAEPVVIKLDDLQAYLDNGFATDRKEVAEFSERLGTVEEALTRVISASVSAREAYVKDLTALHEALIKLNANQHTLAGSIDQWRMDATGDLSIIANRLDKLDSENERPVELMQSLMTTSENMNRLMIERYHRRNRFWYWLFGTDDWITASWPSQVANVEHEMRALRENQRQA